MQKFCVQSDAGQAAMSALPWVYSLPASTVDLGLNWLPKLHKQFLKINLSFSHSFSFIVSTPTPGLSLFSWFCLSLES